ncbi:DUF6241 domain-containing protein [Virgibacillus oceani]|uniref:CTP synthase n=1 Tax=Virgibacillus oceani TaxID=1479511 RepID=A0A917HLG6_9BACI|nr:DUF6241 domain-containing protein [Virgibacillus oceani]GGG83351.1 hypothetical protein GCM10011398_31200 [Virgibacillus oceani]
MKKAFIFILCLLLLAAGVYWGTYKWLEGEGEDVAKGEKTANAEEAERDEIQKQREEIDGTITEEDLTVFKEKGLNPFGEDTKMEELTDIRYQEYIHGMSHQKVKASKKWGFYEIHPERIQWLLDGLDKVDLANEKVYRDILKKWSEANFSSADDDHNTIWNLQGGTVGRAIGVLSAEEEQKYVDNQSE